MQTKNITVFAPIARRLTLSYVLVAVALVAVVVAATSALAFAFYAGALGDATGAFAAHAVQRASAFEQQHVPLQRFAASIAPANARGHIRVLIYDDRRRLLAGTPFPAANAFARTAAGVFGIHDVVAPISGGTIVVTASLAGFGTLLARYLAIILPIGALAVLGAAYVGQTITAQLVALDEARGRDERQMRQFVADAGHELRTPLTIVMGYLDVLQHGMVRDAAEIARVHETMLLESRRMRGVIDKLILLARLERPQPPQRTPVDPAAVAQRAVTALEPLAGGRIRFAAAQPIACVDADESELYEAIENVIENAVRYAPQSPVAVGTSCADGVVQVTVSDRGPGMDETDARHAFDRFYRGSARTQADGSGLGLAIAKRAIERAGGSISLESRLGEGTRITMRLPVSTRASERSTSNRASNGSERHP